jgi:hypothetical protein
MLIRNYIVQKRDERVYEISNTEVVPLLIEAYKYIEIVIRKNHKEMSPRCISDINLLDAFVVNFIQHSMNFEVLHNIEAIIG